MYKPCSSSLATSVRCVLRGESMRGVRSDRMILLARIGANFHCQSENVRAGFLGSFHHFVIRELLLLQHRDVNRRSLEDQHSWLSDGYLPLDNISEICMRIEHLLIPYSAIGFACGDVCTSGLLQSIKVAVVCDATANIQDLFTTHIQGDLGKVHDLGIQYNTVI